MTIGEEITMGTVDWNKLAANTLKAELKRKNITYDQLVTLLEKINVKETQGSLLNKFSRDSFQFSFFLQCASAIGLKVVHLEHLDN
jgi:hypothetical protein